MERLLSKWAKLLSQGSYDELPLNVVEFNRGSFSKDQP